MEATEADVPANTPSYRKLGRSARSTRDQALDAAVQLEVAWASNGDSMSMGRVVEGARMFESYLNGEASADGR